MADLPISSHLDPTQLLPMLMISIDLGAFDRRP